MIEVFGTIGFIVLVAIMLLIVIFCLPAVILSWILSPGKAIWVVLFVLAKKLGWIKISWWWILLGILIPF